MKKLVLLFAALLVAGCGEKSSSEGSESASEKSMGEPSADTAKPPVAESPSEEPSDTPNSLSDADVERLLKEAVDVDSLEERNDQEGNEVYFQPNESESFSGWVKKMYDSGQVQALGHFKKGKKDGPYTEWHENGKKSVEATFKDGEPVGLWTRWHENGQKQIEATFKDGERVSGKYWNSEGEEVETWQEAAKPPPAEPPVAESPSEEPSDTPNSLSDADVERLLKEAVDVDSLEERNGLRYKVNESEPYSGWVKSMRDSGQVQILAQFKDGKRDGLTTMWHENGQKMAEATKKDGKQDGLATAWHENGQKWREETFKDGKEISAKFWNSEGEEVETEEESQGSESASEKPTEEIRKNQTEQKERRKQTGEAQELLERVEQVVRRYLAATSVEEKARYVRHRARVLPLMREYYRRRKLTSARFQSIGDIKPTQVENYPFFVIDVMVEGISDAPVAARGGLCGRRTAFRLGIRSELSADENLGLPGEKADRGDGLSG